MVRYQFTLYDVIVDLVPGTLIVGTAIYTAPVVPRATNPLTSGIVILSLSYIVGRTVHGITSLDQYEKVMISIQKAMLFLPTTRQTHREFDQYVKSISQCPEGSLRHLTAQMALRRLSDQIDGAELSVYADEGDLTFSRYIADSVLYGSGNLSWKYALLATYFRNITLALLISLGLIGMALTWGWLPIRPTNSALLVSGGVATIVSVNERFKFKRRQLRAIVTELAVTENV